MVETRNCGYSAVQDVYGGTDLAPFHNYGVGEQDPAPHLQTNNNVQVPENGFQQSERSLQRNPASFVLFEWHARLIWYPSLPVSPPNTANHTELITFSHVDADSLTREPSLQFTTLVILPFQ